MNIWVICMQYFSADRKRFVSTFLLHKQISDLRGRVARKTPGSSHFLFLHNKLVKLLALRPRHDNRHGGHARHETALIRTYPQQFLLQKSTVIVSFLLGLLPMWMLHRASKWRAARRINALEAATTRLATPAPPPAQDPGLVAEPAERDLPPEPGNPVEPEPSKPA